MRNNIIINIAIGFLLCFNPVNLFSSQRIVHQNLSIGISSLSGVNISNTQSLDIDISTRTNQNNFFNQKFSANIQQHSPGYNTVNLLIRLAIIGSFGVSGIWGRSSLIERYIQMLNQELIFILGCIVIVLFFWTAIDMILLL